jgi:hypothetical protein
MNAERQRLEAARERQIPWKKWGPYLSERQWGTVREDYSPNGDAWNFFTHDHARSRAYRWGEDGIAGISDDKQRYFHGDNGAGLGASHQTGWTGLVAKLIELYGHLDAKTALEGGKGTAFRQAS